MPPTPQPSPGSNASTPDFDGIPPAGLRFLAGLVRHNEREWFRGNHATYRTNLREPMLALAHVLNQRLERFAPEYVTPTRRAVTAINRDMRFARDDTKPYKGWLALAFRRSDATLQTGCSFYVSVSPTEVRVRCGLPLPSPRTVLRLRQHLVLHHAELSAVLRRRGIKNAFGGLQGARYQRVPSDVPRDHPATALLLCRAPCLETLLDSSISETRGFVNEIARRFRVAAPLVRFIDAALFDAAPKP